MSRLELLAQKCDSRAKVYRTSLLELGEEFAHRLGGGGSYKSADEEVGRVLVFLPEDGSLGINLASPLGYHARTKCTVPTIFPSKKCSQTMTALTAAGSSKVRNAKHRDRPPASRMIVHASTLPNWEK